MQKASIGRTVHIRGRNKMWPAIVTGATDHGVLIEAVVFVSRGTSPAEFPSGSAGAGVFTQVSPVTFAAILVPQGDEVGQWSWPKRAA